MKFQFTSLFVMFSCLTESSASSSNLNGECGPGHLYRRTSRRRRSRARYGCYSCKVGQYMPEKNHQVEQCYNCPSGKWSETKASTSCLGNNICLAGQYGKIGAQAFEQVIPCQNCLPGYYTPAPGLGECLACPSGKFNTQTAGTSCQGTTCPAGKYGTVGSHQANSSGCLACPINSFSLYPGWDKCLVCPYGKYGLQTGQMACIKIPKCGSFHLYLKEKAQCQPCHKYILIVGGLAWTTFTLSILIGCCIRPNALWIFVIICNMVIGILTTGCQRNVKAGTYTDGYSIWIMLTFNILSIITAVAIIILTPPPNRDYKS